MCWTLVAARVIAFVCLLQEGALDEDLGDVGPSAHGGPVDPNDHEDCLLRQVHASEFRRIQFRVARSLRQDALKAYKAMMEHLHMEPDDPEEEMAGTLEECLEQCMEQWPVDEMDDIHPEATLDVLLSGKSFPRNSSVVLHCVRLSSRRCFCFPLNALPKPACMCGRPPLR